jgi:hypothetical protein
LSFNVYANGIKWMDDDGAYNLPEGEAEELAERLRVQGYDVEVRPR